MVFSSLKIINKIYLIKSHLLSRMCAAASETLCWMGFRSNRLVHLWRSRPFCSEGHASIEEEPLFIINTWIMLENRRAAAESHCLRRNDLIEREMNQPMRRTLSHRQACTHHLCFPRRSRPVIQLNYGESLFVGVVSWRFT